MDPAVQPQRLVTGSPTTPAESAAKLAAALDQLARARRLHRQRVATARGLTPLQLDILATLAGGPPGPESIVPLAHELGVSQPTVSDAVAALERKELIARGPAPGGRARGVLRLTERGEVAARFDDPVVRIAADLPAHLRGDLLAATLGIIAGLLEVGVITVARNCLTCAFHRFDADHHRCDLLAIDLAPADLRISCPDHQLAG